MTSVRLFLVAAIFLGGAGSKYVTRDLDKISAEYLIVAPPAFADLLDPLCDLRSRSFKVAIARTDDIESRNGKGAEGIAKLVAAAKPKFLLLVGDVDRVPTFVRKSAYTSETFLSDHDVATDHLFGAITGRFSAHTDEELKAIISKTVEYETTLPGGAWQKRIAFVTGQGNFGPLIDPILERQFSTVVSDQIPLGYDIETAYAKPASKYCPYPPKFGENAVRMLNRGALIYAYVGHGLRDSVDDFNWNGFPCPVFEAKDVKSVAVAEGLPIMIVIACNTGEYDSAIGDCIGELLLRRPHGPVAFIGGSRVTQPYGNALFGQKLVDQIFRARAPTLGEALEAARAAVLGADDSTFRKQADGIAGLVQGPSSLEPMRKDVVLQYNLLGDPALQVRRPVESIRLRALGNPGPGRTFSVTGTATRGPVEITFECPRNKFCHPVDLVGDTMEQQLARRYANANNKVVASSKAEVKEGAFESEVELPKDLKPGKYALKAWAGDAFGTAEVEIPE
jgi:hypothetical protein